MRKIIIIVLLLFAQNISAQNIVQLEYFIDSDPGFGNGTQVSITSGSIIDLSFNINLNGVNSGIHTLFIRAKDDEGKWSLVFEKPFLKEAIGSQDALPNITELEYFIDNDPEIGLGTKAAITPGIDVFENFSVDLSQVNYGFHTLFIRAKDVRGQWSLLFEKPFLKEATGSADSPPEITTIDYYFIQNDVTTPVYSYSTFPQSDNIDVNFTANLSALQGGMCKLHLIGQDANEMQSLEYIYEFEVIYEQPPAQIDLVTNPGSDVEVDFENGVIVIFESVTGEGVTSFSTTETGPLPPTGFQIIPSTPSTYYDISTTATYTDKITIEMEYDENQINGDETTLRMFHEENNEVVDVTIALDTENDIITGQVNSLSLFFLAYNTTPPEIVNDKVTFIIQNVTWDPITKIFAYDVALQNISSEALLPPMRVEISNLYPPPPTITVNNSDGGGNGIGAYWDYNNSLGSDNELSPGETSTAKCWEFYNPNMVGFYFSCDIYGVPAASLPKIAVGEGNLPFAMTNDIKKQLVMMNRGEINVAEIAVPKEFILEQNFPNPFNSETMIKYQLPENAKVYLSILNLLGQEICVLVDGKKQAGYHTILWDGKDNSGKDVASGTYMYRIQAGELVDMKKMVLIR